MLGSQVRWGGANSSRSVPRAQAVGWEGSLGVPGSGRDRWPAHACRS